jgi:hypothetical protein
MIHLKRLFWLAAWGVWVWLGFGLAHQLPRPLGPAACKLPISSQSNEGRAILGFVGASDTIAVWMPRTSGERTRRIKLLDGLNGNEHGERIWPNSISDYRDGPLSSDYDASKWLNRGVMVGVDSKTRLHCLDLLDGEWRRLTERHTAIAGCHPEKTWFAIVEGASMEQAESVTVIDWGSGKELFRRPIPENAKISDRPFFLPSRNAVVVPLLFPPGHGEKKRKGKLEVWKLDDPPVLEEAVEGPASIEGSLKFSVSPKGRLFWDTQIYWADAYGISDVYDFNERRFYSSLSKEERRPDGKRGWSFSIARQTISPNGNALFRYSSGKGLATIYEIETARILWQAGPHETAVDESSQEGLIVEERWHELWKRWFPNSKFETVAWRDIDSGEVVCRTPAKTVIDPRNCNISRTLFVAADGNVYRLPLPINWPLLAVCQAVLASPLVLLWSLLWWRRRRAAQRASTAPL